MTAHRSADGTFTMTDANRPEESVAARLQWAFGEPGAGPWHFVPSEAAYMTMIEAVDYRWQRSYAVIEDCLRAMADYER